MSLHRFFYFTKFLLAITLVSCDSDQMRLDQTNINYGKEVDSLSLVFDLPSDYLKALIVLESSGRKIIPVKYEDHVFNELKKVQNGVKKNYHFVFKKHLKNKTDDDLKNLASSWGPFQLMGYKCIQLNIPLNELHEDKATFWGVKWISNEYGDYLRKNKFKEAFHIHNTGSPNKKTTDPNYAKKGLKYMSYFKNNSH
mgnify:CR=1 FL=1